MASMTDEELFAQLHAAIETLSEVGDDVPVSLIVDIDHAVCLLQSRFEWIKWRIEYDGAD